MSRRRHEIWATLGSLAAFCICVFFAVAALLRKEGGVYLYLTLAVAWTLLGLLFLLSAWRLFRAGRRQAPKDPKDPKERNQPRN